MVSVDVRQLFLIVPIYFCIDLKLIHSAYAIIPSHSSFTDDRNRDTLYLHGGKLGYVVAWFVFSFKSLTVKVSVGQAV